MKSIKRYLHLKYKFIWMLTNKNGARMKNMYFDYDKKIRRERGYAEISAEIEDMLIKNALVEIRRKIVTESPAEAGERYHNLFASVFGKDRWDNWPDSMTEEEG